MIVLPNIFKGAGFGKKWKFHFDKLVTWSLFQGEQKNQICISFASNVYITYCFIKCGIHIHFLISKGFFTLLLHRSYMHTTYHKAFWIGLNLGRYKISICLKKSWQMKVWIGTKQAKLTPWALLAAIYNWLILWYGHLLSQS